jgi:hypothetical protein
MTKVAVLLIIETDDARLSPERLDEAMTDATATRALRRAVLAHIPRRVTRVVAVMPEEHARLLMMLHEAVGTDLGAEPFQRPTPDYEPPDGR